MYQIVGPDAAGALVEAHAPHGHGLALGIGISTHPFTLQFDFFSYLEQFVSFANIPAAILPEKYRRD